MREIALDPGYLAFYLPVVVNERQSSEDSRFIPLQAVGKTLEFLDTTGFHLAQPGVELCSLTSMHQAKKILYELIHGHGLSAGLAQSQKFFLLWLRQVIKGTNEEPDGFLGGKVVQDASLFQLSRLFPAHSFQMASKRSIGMRISDAALISRQICWML